MIGPTRLRIKLLSDSCFSRGIGTPGSVDTEIEHDEYGVPLVGGRTVRGLLRDAWLSMAACFPELEPAAGRVLGRSGAFDDECRLRIGDALMSAGLRSAAQQACTRASQALPPREILEALTAIRWQTAEDRGTGAPETTTLRTARVLLRGFALEAPLTWLDGYDPTADDLCCLSLAALAARHGGLGRNRGRGHLRITLDGDLEQTQRWAERTA